LSAFGETEAAMKKVLSAAAGVILGVLVGLLAGGVVGVGIALILGIL
jgi:hypothetical protein